MRLTYAWTLESFHFIDAMHCGSDIERYFHSVVEGAGVVILADHNVDGDLADRAEPW